MKTAGLLFPIGGQKPITGETTYMLPCTDLQGAQQTKSVKVQILPGFREL